MQLDVRHHVFRFQLKFSDAEAAVFFCDCGAMQHAWDVLPAITTTSMSASDFQSRAEPCHHAAAIKHLHDCGHIPFASLMDEAPSSMRAVSFNSSGCPITVLDRSAKQLVLSCDFGDGQPWDAFTRTVIRTDRNQHYLCCRCPPGQASSCSAHIGGLRSWFERHEESCIGDGEVFDGFSFKDQKCHQHMSAEEDSGDAHVSCRSKCRIPMTFPDDHHFFRRTTCSE